MNREDLETVFFGLKDNKSKRLFARAIEDITRRYKVEFGAAAAMAYDLSSEFTSSLEQSFEKTGTDQEGVWV